MRSSRSSLRRDIRLLKAWAVTSSLLVALLALSAFRRPDVQQQRARFAELDVERINIVEPDGKLRMVLSNRPRSIGPIYKGKAFGYPGGSRPGIIFFNDEGTENGGLTFSGKSEPDGSYRASSGFSFDQFNQDQILYFQYDEANGRRRTGFTIADRASVDIHTLVEERDSIMQALPAGAARDSALARWAAPRNGVPLMAQRVYVGRDPARSAVINLSDPDGHPRLRLQVDSLGIATLQFLDASGQVTSQFPDRR